MFNSDCIVITNTRYITDMNIKEEIKIAFLNDWYHVKSAWAVVSIAIAWTFLAGVAVERFIIGG